MKFDDHLLYTTPAVPNPDRVAFFLERKGISIPQKIVNLRKGEHKKPEFLKINPFGQVPALQTGDGDIITETHAICLYFENLCPEPALLGGNPLERAKIEMWNRRVELMLFYNLGQYFRHSSPLLGNAKQIPEFAEFSRERLFDMLACLEEELSDGRKFIAGEFSVADITGKVFFNFFEKMELKVPPEFKNINAWRKNICS